MAIALSIATTVATAVSTAVSAVGSAMAATAFTVGGVAVSWGSVAGAALTAGVGVASGVTSGIMGQQQANQQAKNANALAEQNEKLADRAKSAAEEKARANESEGAARERLLRAQMKSKLAQNRAVIGAGGLDYSGTPLLVEINNAMNMELDIQNERINVENENRLTRYRGQLESLSYQNKAIENRFAAKQYKRQGRNALLNGMVEAGGSVLRAGAGMFASGTKVSGTGLAGAKSLAGTKSGTMAFGRYTLPVGAALRGMEL